MHPAHMLIPACNHRATTLLYHMQCHPPTCAPAKGCRPQSGPAGLPAAAHVPPAASAPVPAQCSCGDELGSSPAGAVQLDPECGPPRPTRPPWPPHGHAGSTQPRLCILVCDPHAAVIKPQLRLLPPAAAAGVKANSTGIVVSAGQACCPNRPTLLSSPTPHNKPPTQTSLGWLQCWPSCLQTALLQSMCGVTSCRCCRSLLLLPPPPLLLQASSHPPLLQLLLAWEGASAAGTHRFWVLLPCCPQHRWLLRFCWRWLLRFYWRCRCPHLPAAAAAAAAAPRQCSLLPKQAGPSHQPPVPQGCCCRRPAHRSCRHRHRRRCRCRLL